MTSRARACALSAATAIALGGGWAAPLAAHADVAAVSYVTWISQPGDYVGHGSPFEVWAPGGGTVTVSGNAAQVVLSTSAGGVNRSFTFAAPDGQNLAVGSYDHAQWIGTRAAGRPGIDISTTSCSYLSGRFEISDIDVSASGVVDRLRLHYEERCSPETESDLVGEVAVNEPPADPTVITVPEAVVFPPTYTSTTSATAEVRLVNEQATPLTVSGVTIGGADAAKFQLLSTTCTAGPLAAGGDCAASVTFAPGADHSAAAAALTFADDSAAGSHVVPLSATVQPGYTSWDMAGDRGDTVLGPHIVTATPATARIWASGTSSSVRASVAWGSGTDQLTFTAPDGQSLATGDYPTATSAATSGAGLTASFTSGAGLCSDPLTGSFHINEVSFDPDTGDVTALSVTFELHCGSSVAGSYGSIAWHAATAAPERAGPGSSTDVTPPAIPALMQRYGGVHQLTLIWLNPPDADWDHTVVREAAGTTPPASPTSGIGVYSGRAQTVTVTKLLSGVSYSYSLWGVDTRGNWSAGARTVMHGTVTVLALPRAAPYGVPFTAAAETIDLVSGKPLRSFMLHFDVLYPGATRWYSAANAVTDTTGVATTNLFFKHAEYVRARFLGAQGVLGSGTSAIYEPLSPGVEGTYLASLKPGGTEKISGTILPNLAGQRIYLQRHSGGKWYTSRSMLLSTRSTFSFAFSLGAGSFTFRLYMPAVKGFQPLYSQSLIVTVR